MNPGALSSDAMKAESWEIPVGEKSECRARIAAARLRELNQSVVTRVSAACEFDGKRQRRGYLYRFKVTAGAALAPPTIHTGW